ncbi:hypothetical protein BH10PLA1_BH10PLA1_12590 [soil metagenome]
MNDPRDYKLDLTSLPPADKEKPAATGRPFLSVLFACCKVYTRLYRDPTGAFYAGHCPKCARPVKFKVGTGGTSARHFVVH